MASTGIVKTSCDVDGMLSFHQCRLAGTRKYTKVLHVGFRFTTSERDRGDYPVYAVPSSTYSVTFLCGPSNGLLETEHSEIALWLKGLWANQMTFDFCAPYLARVARIRDIFFDVESIEDAASTRLDPARVKVRFRDSTESPEAEYPPQVRSKRSRRGSRSSQEEEDEEPGAKMIKLEEEEDEVPKSKIVKLKLGIPATASQRQRLTPAHSTSPKVRNLPLDPASQHETPVLPRSALNAASQKQATRPRFTLNSHVLSSSSATSIVSDGPTGCQQNRGSMAARFTGSKASSKSTEACEDESDWPIDFALDSSQSDVADRSTTFPRDAPEHNTTTTAATDLSNVTRAVPPADAFSATAGALNITDAEINFLAGLANMFAAVDANRVAAQPTNAITASVTLDAPADTNGQTTAQPTTAQSTTAQATTAQTATAQTTPAHTTTATNNPITTTSTPTTTFHPPRPTNAAYTAAYEIWYTGSTGTISPKELRDAMTVIMTQAPSLALLRRAVFARVNGRVSSVYEFEEYMTWVRESGVELRDEPGHE